MSGSDERLSSLAMRMKAQGASVVRGEDGTPIITMPAERKVKAAPSGEEIGANSAGHLKAFVERIERLAEEKESISDDMKEVYSEAKSNGFDPKILRKIIAIRKDPYQYREDSELVETYMHALGML